MAFFDPKRAKWILLFFAIFYALITFVNHRMFRTSSLDLGIYNNAIYDYAHFRANDTRLLTPINSDVGTPYFDNKLSDHFAVTQFLYAPFYHVFGSYTLLIFQWLAVLLGGWGVFRFFSSFDYPRHYGALAMLHYFAFFGFHSALAFDYHDNVIGVSALPWLFLFMRKGNIKGFIILFLLALGCKETISVFFFFVFSVMALFPFEKSRQQRVMSLLAATFSFVYFLIITKVVMPSLANEGRDAYLHFNYTALGESYGDAIQFVITHPWETMKMFFTNHTGSNIGDYIKLELYMVLVLSGAIAWVLRPKWLLIAIPLIAQKVLNDDVPKWGLNHHYSVELVALVTFGLFEALKGLNKYSWRNVVATLLVASTFATTLIKYDGRISKWYIRACQNIFIKQHYQRDFDTAELREALKLIPGDGETSVSAHFNLVPHLAFRKDIYEFPTVDDAEYIAVLTQGYWPMDSQEEYSNAIQDYLDDPGWIIIYEGNMTIIFKRKTSADSKLDFVRP